MRDAVRLDSLLQSSNSAAKRLVIDGGAGRAPRSQVNREEFEKSLGQKFALTVPFDPKAAATSANSGKALVDAAPGTPSAKAMHELVALLSRPIAAAARPKLWQRLLGK